MQGGCEFTHAVWAMKNLRVMNPAGHELGPQLIHRSILPKYPLHGRILAGPHRSESNSKKIITAPIPLAVWPLQRPCWNFPQNAHICCEPA
jgi:hypothetical protein